MKKLKRAAVVFAALCMTFVFTACGGNDQGKDVMKTSAYNVEEVKSLTSETNVELLGKINGKEVNVKTEMSHKIIRNPLTMKMDMKVISDENGKTRTENTKMYAESHGNNLIFYYQLNGKWYREIEDDMDDFNRYNTAESAKTYMEAIKDFERTGTDNINGIMADRYEGTVSGKYFRAIYDESDLEDRFELDRYDDYDDYDDYDNYPEANITSIFGGIDDIPATIWIDSDNMRPVKYQFDMTEAVKTMLVNLGTRGEKITVSKVLMSTVITGYNNVDSIKIPDDVKKAGELEL